MRDLLKTSQWRPRLYYSHYHIQSAALFSRLSFKLEEEYKHNDSTPGEIIGEYIAYTTGSVLAAAASVESYINEIFSDAADDTRGHIHQLGDTILLMGELWRLKVPRTATYSILQKYEIALALARKDQLDHKSHLYANMKLLVELRNALIHYEPEVISKKDSTSNRLEKRLQKKFPLNPLIGKKTAFFPERCMSHGCAAWAVTSSVQFVDDFCARMGIEPIYKGIRPSLITQ
jgi:hypothetical protein